MTVFSHQPVFSDRNTGQSNDEKVMTNATGQEEELWEIQASREGIQIPLSHIVRDGRHELDISGCHFFNL